MPAFYEYSVKIRVPNYLVAQGKTLDAATVQHMLDEEFEGYEGEVKALIVSAPREDQILREQS